LLSLFFIAADVYSQAFCEFFGVANVNIFLSLNQMKLKLFHNCYEQLNLNMAVSFSQFFTPGIFLDTSNQYRIEKVIRMTPERAIWHVDQRTCGWSYCLHTSLSNAVTFSLSARTLDLPLLCFRSVQYLKTNIFAR